MVTNLKTQYRMAEDIQLLANTLIYNQRLRCGSAAIASQTLEIKSTQLSDIPSWISEV